MAGNLKLNRRGVQHLLKVEGAKAVEPEARRIAATAGEGHRVDVQIGRNRARAAVVTDTIEARVAESKHRRLSTAAATRA